MHRLSARTTWYVYEAGASFLGALAFTVTAVYYVTDVGMSPLQLVLVGTLMEVVDLRRSRCRRGSSRTPIRAASRSSIGTFVMGVAVIALRRSRRRVADPRRERTVGVRLHVHEWRVRRLARRRGGAERLAARVPPRSPGRARRARSRASARALRLRSSTSGSRSSSRARGDRARDGLRARDARDGLHTAPARGAGLVRTNGAHRRTGGAARQGAPALLAILGIAAFAGMWSEGFDRLWQAHFIRDVGLPSLGGLDPSSGSASSAPAPSSSSIAVAHPLGKRLEARRARRRWRPRSSGSTPRFS